MKDKLASRKLSKFTVWRTVRPFVNCGQFYRGLEPKISYPTLINNSGLANLEITSLAKLATNVHSIKTAKSVIVSQFTTLRPRQNGRHFPDDIFNCILLTENVYISIKISLKFVRKGQIKKNPAMIQIMAWRRYWCIHESLGLNELRSIK